MTCAHQTELALDPGAGSCGGCIQGRGNALVRHPALSPVGPTVWVVCARDEVNILVARAISACYRVFPPKDRLLVDVFCLSYRHGVSMVSNSDRSDVSVHWLDIDSTRTTTFTIVAYSARIICVVQVSSIQ